MSKEFFQPDGNPPPQPYPEKRERKRDPEWFNPWNIAMVLFFLWLGYSFLEDLIHSVAGGICS